MAFLAPKYDILGLKNFNSLQGIPTMKAQESASGNSFSYCCIFPINLSHKVQFMSLYDDDNQMKFCSMGK